MLSGERRLSMEELEAFEEEKRRIEEQRKKAREERWRRALEEEKQRTRQRIHLALASLLVVGVFAILWVRVSQSLRETTPFGLPAGNIEARSSVAILGFKNTSGNESMEWLSTALAEMLGTELAAGGQLRVIPGENVARMKVELGLEEADSLARDTLGMIRRNLGTDYVVLGSYIALPSGELRLDMRLQDAASGATVAMAAQSGAQRELFDLVARTGEVLRTKLDVESPAARTAALPRDTQAARLYAEGLERLRLFDPLNARDSLEKALAIEPGNPLVHSALATALAGLGYQDDAMRTARKAYEFSSHLPEEERLWVEGQYRVLAQQWDEAIKIYHTLWSAFPDNLEYGLHLANSLVSAGRSEDALQSVEALRRLPPPASEDPRIDIAEAVASGSLSLFQRQEKAAARAAVKGKRLNAILLVAQAKVTEGEALRYQGQPEKALAACEEARTIFEQTGNRAGQALAFAEIGNIHFTTGDYPLAKKMFQESIETYRAIGDQSGVSRALNNIAVVLRREGDLEGAKERYRELRGVSKEVGSQMAEASALNNLGAVLHDEGRLQEAKSHFEEAAEIYRATGFKAGEVSALSNMAVVLRKRGNLEQAQLLHRRALETRKELSDKTGEIASLKHIADVLLDQGDLPGAATMFSQAAAMAREVGAQSQLAEALFGLGEVAYLRHDLDEARQKHRQSLELRRQLGERSAAAESRLALSRLLLATHEPESAERLAFRVVEEARAGNRVDDETAATTALAQALFLQDDLEASRRVIERATTLSERSENRLVGLTLTMQRARILAGQGEVDEAKALLEQALADSTELGLVTSRLRAQLLLAEVETRAGDGEAARARLAELQHEARRLGYRLFVDKASRLGEEAPLEEAAPARAESL